ncbi:unnamed protein product, partial [Polarella glacialis]
MRTVHDSDDSLSPAYVAEDSLAPQKLQSKLTFVPEEERAIKWRLNFVFVGPNAEDFARSVVNSDLAEVYRNSGLANEEGRINSAELGAYPEDHFPRERFILFCVLVENDVASTELARVKITPCVKFSD